jgi:stage III sporulation protein AH
LKVKAWKRNAVLATVILFVCVAVYLNWSYGRGEAAVDGDDDIYTGLDNIVVQNDVDENESEEDDEVIRESPIDGSDALSQASVESDYFAMARLNRQMARDSSLEILRESSDNETLSQEKRDESATALSVLASNAITEAQIENLVIAKGFRDCVAFIGDNESIDIVVATASGGVLQAEDVSKIKEIVVSETGFSTEKINIIEVAQ